jgi:hypothetical protein
MKFNKDDFGGRRESQIEFASAVVAIGIFLIILTIFIVSTFFN